MVLWAPDTAGPWSAVTIKHISMNWQAYFGNLSKKETEVIYCKENWATRHLVLYWTVSFVLGVCLKEVEQRKGAVGSQYPSVHPNIFLRDQIFIQFPQELFSSELRVSFVCWVCTQSADWSVSSVGPLEGSHEAVLQFCSSCSAEPEIPASAKGASNESMISWRQQTSAIQKVPCRLVRKCL